MLLTSDLPNQQNAALRVKRDTTLDNVTAMYNRFVSDSTGKVSVVYLQLPYLSSESANQTSYTVLTDLISNVIVKSFFIKDKLCASVIDQICRGGG